MNYTANSNFSYFSLKFVFAILLGFSTTALVGLMAYGVFFASPASAHGPTLEQLCSNGIDDDNDGLIDLLDPDCSQFIPVCPDGQHLNEVFQCVENQPEDPICNPITQVLVDHVCQDLPTPSVDLCDNIDGVQETVPEGLVQSGNSCVTPAPQPVDVCQNIDGTQESIPQGYESLSPGQCTLIPTPAPTDVCSNIDGNQETVPEGFQGNENICTEINTGSGHHSSGGSGTVYCTAERTTFCKQPGTLSGLVLGASTEQCAEYLHEYIKQGAQNNAGEVLKLQQFLRGTEGFGTLSETSNYDDATEAAVRAFQVKYAGEVLSPWGTTGSTGFVYYTTKKKINEVACQSAREFPLTAGQKAEIERVKAQESGFSANEVQLPASTPSPEVGVESNTEGTVAGTSTEQKSGFWGKFWNWLKGN